MTDPNVTDVIAASARAQLSESTAQFATTLVRMELELAGAHAAEAESHNAMLEYRRLFEQAPVAMFVAAADGQLLNANIALAELLGYADVGQLLACASMPAQRYAEPGRMVELLVALSASQPSIAIVSRFRRRDGSVVALRELVHGVLDGNPLKQYEGVLLEVAAPPSGEELLARDVTRICDDASRAARCR